MLVCVCEWAQLVTILNVSGRHTHTHMQNQPPPSPPLPIPPLPKKNTDSSMIFIIRRHLCECMRKHFNKVHQILLIKKCSTQHNEVDADNKNPRHVDCHKQLQQQQEQQVWIYLLKREREKRRFNRLFFKIWYLNLITYP